MVERKAACENLVKEWRAPSAWHSERLTRKTITYGAQITTGRTLRDSINDPNQTMKHKLKYYNLLMVGVAMCFALPASAQQITGTPGLPDPSVILDVKQLPAP